MSKQLYVALDTFSQSNLGVKTPKSEPFIVEHDHDVKHLVDSGLIKPAKGKFADPAPKKTEGETGQVLTSSVKNKETTIGNVKSVKAAPENKAIKSAPKNK